MYTRVMLKTREHVYEYLRNFLKVCYMVRYFNMHSKPRGKPA